MGVLPLILFIDDEAQGQEQAHFQLSANAICTSFLLPLVCLELCEGSK